jgi:hypothetical protein
MSTLLLRITLHTASGETVKWRPLLSTEHGALCRQAGLDPVRHYFDVPESFHRVGAGSPLMNGRRIGGFIMRAGVDRPVGKIEIAHESERFRDVDPRDQAEFEVL